MKNHWILFTPLLFAIIAAPYTLEGIFPDSGPTTGETRVTIYSPTFKGMNYSDHPTPKCQFSDSPIMPASWIHCIGSAKNPSPEKTETCLNCESVAHAAGNAAVKVSISGNFDDTAEIAFAFYEQAIVDFISPPLGSKRGGTFVQVHGKNFLDQPELACGFGTITVKATYVSPTMLTCKSPSSDVTDAPIPMRVTVNGQQYSSAKENFYFHSVPEVSQLLPNEGSTSGGTEVYIMGKQMYPFENSNISFQNYTFARFGNDHYVRLQLINRTHAKVVSPPSLSATPVPVEITFNDQEWTQNGIQFNYYISPFVIRIIPDLGAGIGGTNVTVMGANFYNTSDIKCRFGDKTVPGHYINDTSVWCIAPASDISQVDFGLSIESDRFSSNKMQYQYISQPRVTDIIPSCGPTTGETQVAVIGRNFITTGVNQAFCIFGDVRQAATVINETLLYCDTPAVVDRFGNNLNNITSFPLKITLNSLEIIDSDKTFTYYTLPTLLSVSPLIGPNEGGRTEVTITGNDFSNSCTIVCRFSTFEVEGRIKPSSNNTQITCSTPDVSCPGQSLLQVSLNGQQYTANDHTNDATLFTHYKPPVAAYALPTIFPTSGNSSVGVYGSGFLLSKNATLSNGDPRVTYQCRFKSSRGNVLGVTQSAYFSDYYIHCKTPALDSATDGVTLEISPNGQSWIPVPSETLSFYDSPAVQTVDPAFGKVRQPSGTIVVKGRNFDCQDAACRNVKCAFTGSNFQIVTDGNRESSQVITCPVPAVSRPEMVQVQVSLNGVDFTNQQVYYTFYDAFVVNLDPGYIPVEGDVEVKVIGFGFAETPELKVRLEDARDDSVLKCGDQSCVFPARFTSPSELTFTAPKQADVKTPDGRPIGFKPINVEVSVYGDSFTNDQVQLSYYQQPEVGANMSVTELRSYEFHQNSISSIFVPINVQFPEGTRAEDFLRKTIILCKYQVSDVTAVTEGKLVQYPYPAAADLDLNQLKIECNTPRLDKTGEGKLSVSLNGANFVGDLPVTVLPRLNINAITPRCGPREGGTRVDVKVGGMQTPELGDFFFSWSSVCTNYFRSDALNDDNIISTVAPAAPVQNTDGGYSLLVFSSNERTEFTNANLTQQRIRNHFESSLDFYYYRRPTITRIYPHGGINTGGTPITIEGAFFFTDAKTSCTPKCKFGDKIVEAKFLSTVRLQCNSPAGELGAFVPLTVTFNGQDEADAVEQQTFAYIGTPNVASISPALGPSTGGTMITVTGRGFVDMSRYPDEFACIFKPVGGREAPKTMPATYLNSTAIACSSPGGWAPGTSAEVEISFNGVDFSSNGVRFRFYQIDRISPLSGPSIGGSRTAIIGTGLVPNVRTGRAACKINNIVVEADTVTPTEIGCTVPAATDGPTYRGNVDFYYTLDGGKWEQAVSGFEYYPQAVITQVIPKYISANGGQLKVKGNNFKADFPGASITCKINNTVVGAQLLNETELNCPFRSINFTPQQDNFVQVALNGASYTDKSEITKVTVFKITEISPQAGVMEGGTQLIVNGINFPQGVVPVCKFGVPGLASVSYGTLLNDHQISCAAPPRQLTNISASPYMVPFTVAFDNEAYNSFDRSGLHYYYYYQPEVIDMTPAQGPVDQSVLVTLTSSDLKSFNDSIIGSTVTQTNSAIESNIVCRFGNFGSTYGAIVAYNQIACPTPNARAATSNVTEGTVEVQIALNGQDFITIPQTFTFVGTPQISSSAVAPLTFVGVALIFILFIAYKRYPSRFNKEKMPLVETNILRMDNQNIQETSQTKIIT